MPQNRINQFGLWINGHDFKEVEDLETPDDKVEVFMKTMNEKVEEVFPTKIIKIFDQDKELMSDELHRIRRAKARGTGRGKSLQSSWTCNKNSSKLRREILRSI